MQYASTLFQLAGDDKATAEKNAATVLKLETEIAKSHRSAVELRDPQKNYNKVMMADLAKISKDKIKICAPVPRPGVRPGRRCNAPGTAPGGAGRRAPRG